jgi:hypothetical protein
MQEITNDIDEQLKEFGCEDFQNKADIVEVVRCKDCKHSYKEGYGLNCSHIGGMNSYVDDNGFCSYGERKEGAEE